MDIIDREIENRLLRNFQNVTVSDRIFENSIVKEGKNYCSKASRFTIHFDKDGRKCEKSFFVKVPYDIQHYEFLKQLQFYAREIYMYEVVLPIYKSLLPNESLHPEFHGTDGREALILEDISKCGYQMMETQKQMDFGHCAEALKLLAKFHALGVKINETDPKLLDPVRNEIVPTSIFLQSEEFRAMFHKRLQRVVHREAPTYAEEHPEVLQFLGTNLFEIMKRELRSENASFNVLNHGDFHFNNIMFAHDDKGQVTNAKCVDFQLSRWASPAEDIMYFTAMCVSPEVFEKHFPILLEAYVTTLNATLDNLKCEQKLDVDILLKDIKKMSVYWLYTLVAFTPVVISDQLYGNGDGMADEYTNDDNYVKLTKFWIPYFIKEGVFSKYEDTATAIDQFTRKFQAENNAIISKYDLEYNVVKAGDNFCSGIIRMNFDYQKDEKTEHRSVLLKIPSLSENYKNVSRLGIYNHEVYMYENYLPKIYELGTGTHFAPICHTVTKTKVLVLEDLNAQGYRTCDRKKQLDLDHCRAALVTLAKYHGLSVKYIQNSKDTLDENLQELSDQDSPSLMAFCYTMYDCFLTVAKSAVPESIHKKLRGNREKLQEIWSSILKINDDSGGFRVIAHGDFWTNNMLFKHDDGGRVVDTKIIDWQISRKAFPVLDLIYFFISSVQFEVFAAHRDTLLNLYADTLNETLSSLECNCKYTRADLDGDLEEHKILFPFFVSFILQIVMTERDSPEFSSTGSNLISAGSYPSLAAKWLNYFVENGII